ncbi:hypothetical protein [Microbacterium kunmingense]|uniref:hypothetical protein n=1 Tax=Microbacterium kunmingense TaxID=2915939 RepID=UPI003D759017
MTPPPEQVVELVRRLATSPWPTSEAERVAWFTQHGLPTHGRAAAEEGSTLSAHAAADGPPGWGTTQWHVFDDAFVGLCWFLWRDASDRETRAAAELLATAFDARWTLVERLDDPVQGFTALWSVDDVHVDLYFHAPRVTPHGHPIDSVVQLHVDHAARAATADAVAASAASPDRSYPDV